MNTETLHLILSAGLVAAAGLRGGMYIGNTLIL